MKLILSILTILMFSLQSIAQTDFESIKKIQEDYSKWKNGYYKNPEPNKLIDKFEYGIKNELIGGFDNGREVIPFYAAIFRNDSSVQDIFFKRFKKIKDIV